MKFESKKYPWLPYVVAVLTFLAVSILYFAPQFRGEVLDMHDVTQYVASSGDIEDHYKTYGEDPQWTGNTFGGMPSYMINFKVHSQIIRKISKWPLKILDEPAALMFTAMLFFWMMLLLWGINPWVGIIPSLAYGLSTYTILIIGAGHISKVWAIAFIPLLIGAIVYTYRSKNPKGMWFGGGLAALAAALEITANHPQITYYFLLVIVALVINELVRAIREKTIPKFLKSTGVLAIAAVLAVGANAGTLYYTAQHTGDTTRGQSELAKQLETGQDEGLEIGYATAWSYGIAESFNMFIPNFMGGASDKGFSPNGDVSKVTRKYGARPSDITPSYWGKQPFTAGPTYIGAVIIFLAILGLFLLEGRKKWWLLIISIFALFLSWGHNMLWFTELCFRILPGYNRFRAVSTALVVLQWTLPLLAALILSEIWKGEIPKKRLMKGLKWSTAIAGGVALIFALLGPKLFDFASPVDGYYPDDIAEAMRAERGSMMRMDSWRSLLFVLVAGGLILLFARDRMKRGILVAAMAGLVAFDLAVVDMRYLSWGDFVSKRRIEIKATPADLDILEDTEPGYRVIDLTTNPFSDARASYFHRSVGGYHGAKLQRYQDLIDFHLGEMNMEAYNMLNTKYFIVPDQETGEPRAEYNPDANGPAWFVEEVMFVDTPLDDIEAIGIVDTKYTAIIDRRLAGNLPAQPEFADALDWIELTDYKVNHLTYDYSSATDAVAVFSEIYYDKGWTAYVDGQPTPYFRTDYLLRGMYLPAGEHTVEFMFRAPNFAAVSGVTLTSSIVILLWFAAGCVLMIVGHRRKEEE